MLHKGIGWEHLPQELGFGCGMTAWRRLHWWQRAGPWSALHRAAVRVTAHRRGDRLGAGGEGGRGADPTGCLADRGYDHDKYRRLLWQRGIKPVIARRQTEHGSGLGRERLIVERTISHLHNKRRLLVRTDRSSTTH